MINKKKYYMETSKKILIIFKDKDSSGICAKKFQERRVFKKYIFTIHSFGKNANIFPYFRGFGVLGVWPIFDMEQLVSRLSL